MLIISSLTFAKDLQLPLFSEIASLDPRIGSEKTNNVVIGCLYESLFRYNPDGEIIPALCKNWKVSTDGLKYTFYLKDSVWSDGSPCTAYDFEYAWKKCVDPQFVERATYVMYPIKNAQASVLGKVSLDDVGVKALDKNTLELHLEYPTDYIFHACAAHSNYKPIPKHHDEQDPKRLKGARKNVITNGPFELKKWNSNDKIILEKSLNYWDKENVYFGSIIFNIIESSNTAVLLFEKGKLDWVGEPLIVVEDDHISGGRRKAFKSVDVDMVDYLSINTKAYPFDNLNFRKAIAYAVDRKEIADNLFAKNTKIATTSLLNGSVSVKDGEYFTYSEEKAKKHLSTALKEMGVSAEDLNIEYCVRSGYEKQAIFLQEQFKKILGLKVGIRTKEWNSHFSDMRNGNYQIGEISLTSYIPGPEFYLFSFIEANAPLNLSNWENIVFNDLFYRAKVSEDICKKRKYYQLAECLFIENFPIIPVTQRIAKYKTNSKLKGYYFSPGFYLDLKNAYFDD